MIKSLATAGVLLLVLTGCGGSSSGDDKKAAKAISEDIMSQAGESSGFEMTQSQADCVGEGAVDEFGIESLVSLGLLNDNLTVADGDFEDLDAEDATRMIEVFVGCIDVVQLIKDEIASDPSMAALPESVRTCIDTTLTEDVAVALFTDQFTGTTTGQDDFQQKLMACALGS